MPLTSSPLLYAIPADPSAGNGIGYLARAEGYEVAVQHSENMRKRVAYEKSQGRPAIIQANHSAAFCANKVHYHAAPTLTTGTHLYELTSQQFWDVASHWVIMGYPHPGAQIGDALKLTFPFPSVCAKVPISSQRRLTGNGMHLAVAAYTIAHALCAREVSDTDEEEESSGVPDSD